jgi:hypothetical protein
MKALVAVTLAAVAALRGVANGAMLRQSVTLAFGDPSNVSNDAPANATDNAAANAAANAFVKGAAIAANAAANAAENAGWADGTRCVLGSCNNCRNKATWWWGKAGQHCGMEPKWPDGTHCGKGTTCKMCQNEATYWWSKAWTMCGTEPRWPDGTACGAGSTCKACQNKATYWSSKLWTACGNEPPHMAIDWREPFGLDLVTG